MIIFQMQVDSEIEKRGRIAWLIEYTDTDMNCVIRR